MNKTHGGNVWQVSKETGLSHQDIIDFSSSINPLGMSKKAIAALKEIHKIIPSYPEPSAFDARQELSRFHNISVENILAGNGSTEFIYLIPQVFKPKKALIIEPAFSEYRRSLELSGCKVFEFILREKDGFLLDENALMERLRRRHYSLLYIGNPSNPLGALLKKDLLIRLANVCRQRKTVMVVDEELTRDADDAQSADVEAATNEHDEELTEEARAERRRNE